MYLSTNSKSWKRHVTMGWRMIIGTLGTPPREDTLRQHRCTWHVAPPTRITRAHSITTFATNAAVRWSLVSSIRCFAHQLTFRLTPSCVVCDHRQSRPSVRRGVAMIVPASRSLAVIPSFSNAWQMLRICEPSSS